MTKRLCSACEKLLAENNEITGLPEIVTDGAKKLFKKLRGSNDKGESSGSTSTFRNVVHLSVTGLTKEGLLDFWRSLKNYENLGLTSLGVAVTRGAKIEQLDSKYIPKKLKDNLERLRMEGQHSGLEYLGAFGVLNDLTLVSHGNMDFGKIPDTETLLCLGLYGVFPKEICEIDLNGCPNLKKLVIGNVERIGKNGSAELKKVVTLNLPHSLIEWKKSNAPVSKEVKPNKTLFLKKSRDSTSPEIYHCDEKKKWYKLKAT